MECKVKKLNPYYLLLIFYFFGTQSVTANNQNLVIYTYDSFVAEWGPAPQIKEEFEKICKCTVEFIGFPNSLDIIGRLKLEGSSSKADIILGLDTNQIFELENSNIVQKHNIEAKKMHLPIEWSNENFLPYDWGHFSFIYNDEKIKTLPNSFKEFIENKNNNTIIIQDPRTSTPGLGLLLWIKSIYGEASIDKWKKLSKSIKTVTSGWSEAYGMFLDGQSDFVLSYSTSPAYHMIVEEKNNYKSLIFDEGHYLQVEVMAITKNTKNYELAKSFLTFMLEDEVQSIIPTTNWMFPIKKQSIPEGFLKLKLPEKVFLMTPDKVFKNKKIWINEWLVESGF